MTYIIQSTKINALTANNSNPTIATMETGANFPRKSVKSPTEFIAAKRRAFPTTIRKARFAEVQNPFPVIAEVMQTVITKYLHFQYTISQFLACNMSMYLNMLIVIFQCLKI